MKNRQAGNGVIANNGINGSLRKREVTQPQQHTEYYMFNSQGNLKAYSDDVMSFAYYGYNAANTRTYKLSLYNTNLWINGQQQPLNMQLQNAMFYPNTYLNFNGNGEYTKHYYNGMERIASRLGDNTTTIALNNNILEDRKLSLEEHFREDIHKLIEETVPIDMPPFIDVNTLQPTGTPNDIYYYHPNHLGNTAFITDNNATITQGFLYAPFGEITTEYNVNFGNNTIPKYAFNAKELDEETGMYYYEARYYAPPTFTSRDPMMDSIPYFSPYSYCVNNPLKYTDLNGNIPILIPIVWGVVELGLAIYDTYTAYQTLKDQNASTLDKSLAITGVLCSAVLPGGGYGVGFKMSKKTIFKIGEKTIDKASDYYRATKRMSPEERVATYKRTAADVAKKEGWIKNKTLSTKNGRDIYTSKDGKYHFSLDTENGHFEVLDKRGKHMGSFDFDGTPTKPRDKKSGHDINM